MEVLRQIQSSWPPWAFDFLKFGNGLLLLALIFVPLERLFSARPQPAFRSGWKTDVFYYFLSSLLPPKLVVLAVLGLVLLLEAWAPRGLFPALAELPIWLRFPLMFLIAEVGFYWGHRWMHASAWLWRFHAVHHSAAELDWLVNTRAHPLDLILTRLCGLLPLYLLGLVQVGGAGIDPLPLFVALATSAWGYFIHANVRFNLVLLQPLVTTPAFHQWHHANEGPGGRHHVNYAAMLPLMDRLFGTYRRAGTERPQRLGTAETVPTNVVDQLMAPFMGSPDRAAPRPASGTASAPPTGSAKNR